LFSPVANGYNTPEHPGETLGQAFGGVWFVGRNYSVMLANTQLVGHNGKSYKSDLTEGSGKTIYFTDGNGVTLYTFSHDKANKNNFTAADFSNNGIWPIYETDKAVVPSTLDKSLFGSIDVYGKKQLTYKGWPLYYFGQDAKVRGSNKGISYPVPGIWPVATQNMPAAPL
jgi:predicted lipoprotein with Yx(FWY)xxD motif